MKIFVCKSKQELGKRAADEGIQCLKKAIQRKGKAAMIVATGASQFDTLRELVSSDLEWNKITIFHLDEYMGMSIRHPASFRKYLWERFARKLPLPPAAFHFIDGEVDPEKECERLGRLIKKTPIDVAFVGIGENGHLAFNDPPADFNTKKPFFVVQLDPACRKQQLGEGWFKRIEDVPQRAISMSCQQILKSRKIICSTPDRRKAQAVQACVKGDISPMTPASILRRHPSTTLWLDRASASLLGNV